MSHDAVGAILGVKIDLGVSKQVLIASRTKRSGLLLVQIGRVLNLVLHGLGEIREQLLLRSKPTYDDGDFIVVLPTSRSHLLECDLCPEPLQSLSV